jgi:alpha-L-arabinofuranosidase
MRNLLIALCLAVASAAYSQSGSVTVDVGHPAHNVSPDFYGLMTEEINHSYDGGLYGELIQNRSFRDAKTPAHWSPVGDSQIALEASDPANPSLHVEGGVSNDGYWGVPVQPNENLKFRIIARSETNSRVQISVADAKSGPISLGREWKSIEGTITPGEALTNGRVVVSTPGKGSFDLRYLSLFPPTFHHRPSGNRVDLMEALAGLHPRFLRLPGGNYLEGNTLADYFPWKSTLSDPADRPGHWGPWGYRSSDGMGLPEFLYWCEDLKMAPVLAVYAGYALNGTHVAGGPHLQPFVQDALDEIEFVSGSTNTQWGAVRAKLGHPKPFPLTYVEVGNEDAFDRSGSYDARFAQFFNAIKAADPKLKIIATAPVNGVVPDLVDDHYYRSGAAMARDEHHYDAADRSGPKIFVGEWASTEGRPTPNLEAALGDAAWLIGLERNSDLVLMEAYAPLLVNVNVGASQWGTNLIGFDGKRTVLSPSYYVQSLFAKYTGDEVLPVSVDAKEPASISAALKGRAGLATYRSQVEFKDFSVTGPSGANYDKPFSADDPAWTQRGGTWAVTDGDLIQTSNERTAQIVVGDPAWSDYTVHVKAKKLSGREGFIVLFNQAPGQSCQWNVGGWNNTRSAIQITSQGDQVELATTNDTVETGRWYDVTVAVSQNHARCYLDGRLVTEADLVIPPVPAIHVGALRDSKTGAVTLRVVNFSAIPYDLHFLLKGLKGRDAKAWTMSGLPEDQNSISDPNRVVPRAETWKVSGEELDRTLPPYSVSVVQFKG